jgi:hypothetical protein
MRAFAGSAEADRASTVISHATCGAHEDISQGSLLATAPA